jgi:hypothetical protein
VAASRAFPIRACAPLGDVPTRAASVITTHDPAGDTESRRGVRTRFRSYGKSAAICENSAQTGQNASSRVKAISEHAKDNSAVCKFYTCSLATPMFLPTSSDFAEWPLILLSRKRVQTGTHRNANERDEGRSCMSRIHDRPGALHCVRYGFVSQRTLIVMRRRVARRTPPFRVLAVTRCSPHACSRRAAIAAAWRTKGEIHSHADLRPELGHLSKAV